MEKLVKNLKDHFKKQNPFEKIAFVIFTLFILFSAVMAIYLFLVYSSFSFKLIYSLYLEPLGFDYASPLKSFSLLFLLEIVGFFIYYLVKKKINWYFFSTFVLITFIFIFGLSFISSSYAVDLPSSRPWNIRFAEERDILVLDNGCNFSRLDCKSVTDKQYFVEGDEVYCQFTLSKECNATMHSFFDVRKVYLNSKEESEINVSLSDKQTVFQIEVEEGLKALWVIPYFSVDEKVIAPFYIYQEFENVYSQEEYNTRQFEKASLFIALISLSIFTTIVAMNNLKQLLEKTKKN